jgi:replication-associated recombination protein RarA
VLRGMTDEIIRTEFGDIIGRDAHLRIIHSATENFIKSRGVMRSHTVLYGPPGAAKTSMFLKLKDFYERDSEVERVYALDATAISKAGLENWMLDRAEDGTLPEILYLEEVEKFDLNILLPLAIVA